MRNRFAHERVAFIAGATEADLIAQLGSPASKGVPEIIAGDIIYQRRNVFT
jgi:hypothetical protein